MTKITALPFVSHNGWKHFRTILHNNKLSPGSRNGADLVNLNSFI